MLTAMVVCLFLPAALIEYRTALRGAKKRAKVIHVLIMLVSFCVLVLYSLEIPVPSPTDAITGAIEAIMKLAR